MNNSQTLLTQQILDYMNYYMTYIPINNDLKSLSREFILQYQARKQMLQTKLNLSNIKQLDFSSKIEGSQQKLLTYHTQLMQLQQSEEQIIQQIDNKQSELVQLEKRQSFKKSNSKQQKLLELVEGLDICENTLETVKSEFNENHKIIDWESSLNQQLKQTYDKLQKQNEENILTINQINQSMSNNNKKIIKSLQLISDLRQMIVNQKSTNQSNQSPFQVDEIKIIQSIIEKIENTKLPGKEQQEHEILNSVQQMIHLKEQSNTIKINLPLKLEQTEDLVTCDRTFSTPRFQNSVRIKANDILPQARIRTEADDKVEYACEKRISTDCGFYEEDEQNNEDIQVLKVPFQSKKSLNCERAKKKKQSYISVASFSSETSSNNKYINLQDELNYLGEINEYYCTRKFIDDQLIIAPCQTPLEQSIEIYPKQQDLVEEKPKSQSLMKKILGTGIALGLSFVCYKFFKK